MVKDKYQIRIDAYNEHAKTLGYNNCDDYLESSDCIDRELFKEEAALLLAKATEELRKENEALTEQLALKATPKEMQMYIADLKGQIERLNESNKELVEALDDACENLELQLGRLGCTLYGDGKEHLADNDSFGGFRILEKSRELIKKSEGDVNKKV